MGGFRTCKTAALAAIGAAAFAGSSASAGRCGGTYPADAPTTLGEVARQCNVRLSDLREANPGVDPDDVRPGERLAVPDEIRDDAAAGAGPSPGWRAAQTSFAGAADMRMPSTDDTALAGNAGRVGDDRDDNWRGAHRIRVRDHRTSDDRPAWIARDAMPAGRYSSTAHLSFQKLSAMRILSAGLPDPAVRYAYSSGAPETRLVECMVLEKNDYGDVERMRKIVSTPANTFVELDRLSGGDAFDCTLINLSDTTTVPSPPGYRVPDYGSIGWKRSDATPRGPATFALTGEIVDSYRGCLLLKTRSGGLWRLSATQPAEDLLGKQVTVWGASVLGGACGAGPSMAISHAVYAEPWATN